MTISRRTPSFSAYVAFGSLVLFSLPFVLFLAHFWQRAPFYFLAEDAFYYLSIALHSTGVPFFSIDGLHPTNGFHPLWEWTEFGLSHLSFFRLEGPEVLSRFFALNLAIVAAAVAMLSTFVYRLTRRPWLAAFTFSPGLLWLLVGIGSPAYVTLWASVNGMETGLELFFLSLTLLLFGESIASGWRSVVGACTLGLLILSRLDDVFFLVGVLCVLLVKTPAPSRPKRLLPFLLPCLMVGAYLLYNHHSLGVWLPVSGMAKAGHGFHSSVGETARLLGGWFFFTLPAYAVAFSFASTYVIVIQMLAPMLVVAFWLWWGRRFGHARSPVLLALVLGVLLKGAYNLIRVPVGYQGSWYYGASIATANILLATVAADVCSALERSSLVTAAPRQHLPVSISAPLRIALLLACSFLSFNVVATRATLNGYPPKLAAWKARGQITAALRASTAAPFLEFQDGELSFLTGLPSESGFGLAADPEAIRAQRNGTYFQLLARRGVTVAAASNTYPGAIAEAGFSKRIYAAWGFNPAEMQQYCFQPFWHEPESNTVLYHIVHQPICPPAAAR